MQKPKRPLQADSEDTTSAQKQVGWIDRFLPWKQSELELSQKLQKEQQMVKDSSKIEETLHEELRISLSVIREAQLEKMKLVDRNKELLDQEEKLLQEIDYQGRNLKKAEEDIATHELQILELQETGDKQLLLIEEKENLLQDMSRDLKSANKSKGSLEKELKASKETVDSLKLCLKKFEEREEQFKESEKREASFKKEIEESRIMLEQAINTVSERNKELKESKEQVESLERKLNEKTAESQEAIQSVESQVKELEQQLEHKSRIESALQEQLHEIVTSSQEELQQLRVANNSLKKDLNLFKADSSWILERKEIEITDHVLGQGGWGKVAIANFRGTKVAAKSLHQLIISQHNIAIFTREMEIAAKLRHPNVVQQIGATREGNPIILTELMPTSLRKELEMTNLSQPQILSISQDVCKALNYIHLWRPHPIIHRDISSSNVLLEPSGSGQWKGKLSDFGSANVAHKIVTTVLPGCPAYAAPEASNPEKHSPAMDVYSFGVMLMEMVLCEFPPTTHAERTEKAKGIKWDPVKEVVQKCIKKNRPQTYKVLSDLNSIHL